MSVRVLCCAAVLTALPVAQAHAQTRPPAPVVTYRDGLPAVNAPPAVVDPNRGAYAAAAAFARWNAAAGRPSILLFWNRELLEDAASQYDTVRTRRTDAAADAVRGHRTASVSASSTTEERDYQERSTDGRYGAVDRAFSRDVEAALTSAFLSNGARLMDRAAMIRKVSARQDRDERLDVQHLETLAVAQGVQYLIEVLPDQDPASPTGVHFTVKVTHLPTASVRAQFVTTGAPPSGPARWVAAPGGFEKRAAAASNAPSAVGAEVAYEIMARLH